MTDETPANNSVPEKSKPTLADQHWRATLRSRTRSDLEDDMEEAIEKNNVWRFRMLMQLDKSWGGEESVLKKAVEHGRQQMFRDMVKAYPEWEDRVTAGRLATAAAEKGQLEFVRMFVEELKVEVHYNNDMMLREAAEENHTEVVRYLVSKGADAAVWSNDPIREASKHGNLEMLKILVEAGADINAYNGEPLSKAVDNGNAEMVDYLLKKGADPGKGKSGPFMDAAREGNVAVLEAFINNNVRADMADSEALVDALSQSQTQAAQYLIDQGAKVNAQRGKALRMAAGRNDMEVVKFLLAHNAEVNISEGRETPLTQAVSSGHGDMALYLMRHGADSAMLQHEAWEATKRLYDAKKKQDMEAILAKGDREALTVIRKKKNAEFEKAFGGNYTVSDLREKQGPSGDTGLIIAAQTGRFGEIVAAAKEGQLEPDDLYHPDDRVDTVLSFLARHESIQQFFKPEFWAERANEVAQAHAMLPEEMRKGIEMGSIANEINFRALRKKAKDLNNSLKPGNKGPAPGP